MALSANQAKGIKQTSPAGIIYKPEINASGSGCCDLASPPGDLGVRARERVAVLNELRTGTVLGVGLLCGRTSCRHKRAPATKEGEEMDVMFLSLLLTFVVVLVESVARIFLAKFANGVELKPFRERNIMVFSQRPYNFRKDHFLFAVLAMRINDEN